MNTLILIDLLQKYRNGQKIYTNGCVYYKSITMIFYNIQNLANIGFVVLWADGYCFNVLPQIESFNTNF